MNAKIHVCTSVRLYLLLLHDDRQDAEITIMKRWSWYMYTEVVKLFLKFFVNSSNFLSWPSSDVRYTNKIIDERILQVSKKSRV